MEDMMTSSLRPFFLSQPHGVSRHLRAVGLAILTQALLGAVGKAHADPTPAPPAASAPVSIDTLVRQVELARRQAASSNSVLSQIDLAHSLTTLCNEQTGDKQYDAALASCTENVLIRRKISAIYPNFSLAQQELAWGLVLLGFVQEYIGALDAASSSSSESMEILLKFPSQNSTTYLGALAMALELRGTIQERKGLLDAAKNSFTSRDQNYRDAAKIFEEDGLNQQSSGNIKSALVSFEQSLKFRKFLSESPQSQFEISASLEQIGDTKRQLGDFSGARASYDECWKIRYNLYKSNDSSKRNIRSLSVILEHIGDLQLATKDMASAQASYVESQKLRKRLVDAFKDDVESQRDYAVILGKLGELQKSQKENNKAKANIEESLRIHKRLASQNQNDPVVQRDLAVRLQQLGSFLRDTADPTGAKANYEESLQIFRSLASMSPESAPAQRGVWSTLWQMAMTANSGVTWKQVHDTMQATKERGKLMAADEGLLVTARANAARE